MPKLLTVDDIMDAFCRDELMKAIAQICTRVDPNGPPRHGGVLLVAVVNTSATTGPQTDMLSQLIGTDPDDKVHGRTKHAAEKFERVRRLRKAGGDDVCSSTSADPDNPDETRRTYGGCVVFPGDGGFETYLSFSGAPADVDEAAMFALGKALGLPLPADYAVQSGNTRIEIAETVFSEMVKIELPDPTDSGTAAL